MTILTPDGADITYYDFGVDLLTTYDLDPLYPALVMSGMSTEMLKRWLLAYWCYYSAGVASYIAEQPEFYKAMFEGLFSSYPRGHERRHWRGDAAKASLMDLMRFGYAETVVDAMTAGSDFQAISKAVQQFRGFGPWIGWKVADMTERVLQRPVNFDNAELGVYRDPVKGAALILHGDQHAPITLDELHTVIDESLDMFAGFLAPPYQDRPVNIQEIETILCKYKSHFNGHYPLGNDSHDIAHGLVGWGDLAQQLGKCLQQVTTYKVAHL